MECNDFPDDVFLDRQHVVKVPKKRGRQKKVEPSGEDDPEMDVDADDVRGRCRFFFRVWEW